MVKIGGARLEDVSPFFHLPIEEAARELGVCSSALKRRCRRLGIKRWPFRKVRSMSNSLSRTMEGMCNVGAGGIVPPEYLQPDAATRLAAQVAAANLINLDQTRRPLLPPMNRPLMGGRGAAGAAAPAAGGDAGTGTGGMVAQMGGSAGGGGGSGGVDGEGDENQEAGAIVLHMGDSPVLAWESPDKCDEQNPWEGGGGGMEDGFRGAEAVMRQNAVGEGGPSLMLSVIRHAAASRAEADKEAPHHPSPPSHAESYSIFLQSYCRHCHYSYPHPWQSRSCLPSFPRSLRSRSSLPPTASLFSPPSPLLLLLGASQSPAPHRPLAIGAAAALC
ncbi:unnamed protein product [Closterium sp. Naga37s-1]|nr:unnamed protein product [Closterium sp. Naga37s-1]